MYTIVWKPYIFKRYPPYPLCHSMYIVQCQNEPSGIYLLENIKIFANMCGNWQYFVWLMSITECDTVIIMNEENFIYVAE